MGTIVFPYQGQLRKLLPPRWVRLTSATTQAYISQAPSDASTGLFSIQGDVPNGTYTLATGATQAGPWTTEDSSFLVASNPAPISTAGVGGPAYDTGGAATNVRAAGYNAPLGVLISDAAITSGQAIVTSPSNGLGAVTGNMLVAIIGAGAAGATLVGTVLSSPAPTAGAATISVNAGTTVTGKQAVFGADASVGWNAAIASGAGRVTGPVACWVLSNPLTPKSNCHVDNQQGTVFAWAGSTNNQMLYSNPSVGAPINRFKFDNAVLDANNIAGVSQIFLQSWQYGGLDDVWVKNGALTGGVTAAVRLEGNIGADFTGNTVGNVIRNLRITTCQVALQLSGTGANGPAATDNWFIGLAIDDCYQTGIRFVQFCDSNVFFGCRVGAHLNGAGLTNFAGVIFNDSATPAADVGVYDEQFFGFFVDAPSGTASQSAVVLNWQRQSHISALWTSIGIPSGSLGTTVKDNNSQSHYIEVLSANQASPYQTLVYTKGYRMGPISLGADLANYLDFAGAANGSAPSITSRGTSDADVAMLLNTKGAGVLGLLQNYANFYNLSGGADGGGSAPYFATAGTAADIDWRLLFKGNGRLVVPAGGIKAQGSAPTVGSGGAGTSALSILAGSTNIAGQFQVTLTAVAPGVVAGVVAFNGGPLPAAPKVVLVSLAAPTAGVAAPPVVAADTYTASGFTVRITGPTTVTTGTYVINFWVVFS